MNTLTINNLYFYYPDPDDVDIEFFYIINEVAYAAPNLEHMTELPAERFHYPSFNISSEGSDILMIITDTTTSIPFQRLANGRFVELLPRPVEDLINTSFIDADVLQVPLPGGEEGEEGFFEQLILSSIDRQIVNDVRDYYTGVTIDLNTYEDILEFINEPPVPNIRDIDNDLHRLREVEQYLSARIEIAREGGRLRDLLGDRLNEVMGAIDHILHPPQEESYFVYIYNVSSRTRGVDVAQLMREYGDVRSLEHIDDHYVASFRNESSANRAVLNLNGRLLDNNVLRVTREPIVVETVIEQQAPDNLTKESHAVYMSQVYGLPVVLPEFLIINGLKVNFISFQEVFNMLNQNQIERYILDPVLQPWAGLPSSPNRIITMFNKNGMTYLVKAKYDAVSNQIFSPV